jgi:hypothetical protein
MIALYGIAVKYRTDLNVPLGTVATLLSNSNWDEASQWLGFIFPSSKESDARVVDDGSRTRHRKLVRSGDI